VNPARGLSRRAVLAGLAAAVSGAAGMPWPAEPSAASDRPAGHDPAASRKPAAGTPRGEGWFTPSDDAPHERTWMAWPARRDIWGPMLAGVRSDVASVARAIAAFEPVAMVARPDQARNAARACGKDVEIVELVNDDLWMRDMGPVFLVNGRGGLAGLDLNFNGWGNKQAHAHDARIARELLRLLGVRRFTTPFVSGYVRVKGSCRGFGRVRRSCGSRTGVPVAGSARRRAVSRRPRQAGAAPPMSPTTRPVPAGYAPCAGLRSGAVR
jgi:agmatine deiminase